METIQYYYKFSKIGGTYLTANEQGLSGIYWKKQNGPLTKSLRHKNTPDIYILAAIKQLEQYLNGKRKQFDLLLSFSGTEFQIKVWSELQKIPFAQTISYQQLAKNIKNPKAVRAVGSANGKNPLSIVIPCHRVIAKNGSLSGYAGGASIKKNLLDLEKNNHQSTVATGS